MSAKEFYHKTTFRPTIPPEIWGEILRWATFVPGLFHPELRSTWAGTVSNSIYRDQMRKFRTSLITKRYIIRVCKAWYSYASPFLYESILLGRGRVLSPLSNSLARMEHQSQTSDGAPENHHSLGWYTKRLDVHLRDPALSQQPEGARTLDLLASILTHLPNLEVLTFRITGQGYNGHIPTHVLQACTSNLKFISWENELLSPTYHAWTHLLTTHTNLEAILSEFGIVPGPTPIVLESVKSVCIYPSTAHCLGGFSWIQLPNLQHVILDVAVVRPLETIPTLRFFETMGERLTSIELTNLHPRSYIVQLMERTFAQLQAHSPNLTRVDMGFSTWMEIEIFTFSRTVNTLGVRGRPQGVSRSVTQLVLNSLIKFLSQNPSIRTLQFTDPSNLLHFRRQKAFSTLLGQIVGLGVSAQDHEATPLG